ncbi:MAG: hypothetical protein IKP40_07000 [Clostridia bacterium]|nr:hypothetical protein [Clostridia bacterium]
MSKARRLIILMLILLPMAAYATIALANNTIAKHLETRLLSQAAPPESAVLDSLWIAGKMRGNGNGMQYFGELLIQSDLDQDELEAYYADLSDERTSLNIYPQESPVIFEYPKHQFQRFDEDRTLWRIELSRNVAVGCEENFWEGVLNWDLRGH